MDFYILLGVGQDATSADIKRAFRRLARRYHPGINPGDRTAEAMFDRISEAYDTLIDPGRRQQYDRSGGRMTPPEEAGSTTFTEFDFSVAAQGAQAATFGELFADVLQPFTFSDRDEPTVGADLHATLKLSFAEALRGVERQVVVTRHVTCGTCAGSGQVVAREAPCGHCRGAGQLRWARGHMVFSKPCAACGGTGRQSWQRCAACSGHGHGVRSEAVSIVVPPGTADGARLRIADKGHAGRRGGRPGDLYVAAHVEAHPWLRRDGDDVVCALPVAVHEAVLGARFDVPTLDGPVRIRIRPGTQAGQQLRVIGRGAPTADGARGDLVFEVVLVLPEALNDRSRDLMRAFARLDEGDVRKNLKV